MSQLFLKQTAESYDRVAAAYVQRFQHELDHKPFDRKILELLVEKVGTKVPICDMGCGPGHIAAYVHQLGAAACGIDLSAQMVAEAQRLHPDIPFQQGDMLGLKAVEKEAFGGIAAFYVHHSYSTLAGRSCITRIGTSSAAGWPSAGDISHRQRNSSSGHLF